MKAFFSIVLILIIVAVLGGVITGAKSRPATTGGTTPTGGLATRLKQCPDEMIINNMPGPGEKKTSYYVLKGERKEISEFDEAWVSANCNVPTQAVY
jgi:hypothetical protein